MLSTLVEKKVIREKSEINSRQFRLRQICCRRLFLLLLPLILTVISWSAQATLSLDFDSGDASFSSRMLQIIAIITILSVAPSILIMFTSFTRIAVVFSFLRNALGLQQTPPNQVMISLALFLTFFIMAPTFERAYEDGFLPLMQNNMDEGDALQAMLNPFENFMYNNVREKDLLMFAEMANIDKIEKDSIPLYVLIPSFMISELKRAFEIGFLLFLPFLIIDMLVASVLMAMGMMMLPPVIISLPFKVVFFVLVDGWYLLCGSLVRSYS